MLLACLAALSALAAAAAPASAGGPGFNFNGPPDAGYLNGPVTGFSGDIDLDLTHHKAVVGVLFWRINTDSSTTLTTRFREDMSFCFFTCEDYNWTDESGFGYTVEKSGALPSEDGQYRVHALQVSDDPDLYANINDIREFTIDSLPPSTAIDSGPPAITQVTSPAFTFSGSDPDPPNGFGSGIDRFECKLDGGAWTPCASGDPIHAGEGDHTLEVRAVDKAGNVDGSPATYAWLSDTTPPDITITKPLSKDRYLLHEGPSPVFSCSDPLRGTPPGASGFAPSGALTTSSAPGCTATPINDEDLGPHKFTVTATDRAGNSSTKTVAYTIDPPDYGKFVMEDHPLAYYRHNEGLGSETMLDSSGHGRHGTYQNGVALGRDGATNCERRPHPPRVCETAAPPGQHSPPENKAAFFGPRDKHGYVNGIAAPTSAYTMEAWIKPRTGENMMVMGHGGGGQLFIQGRRLAFRQTQDTIVSPGPNIPIGEWTHVAATWDGHHTRLYVNGVEVAHATHANKPPSGSSTFYVGYGEMAPWFHGEIDESALYDHALSAHRLSDRHKIAKAKDVPSLEAGPSDFNTEGPFTDPAAPKNGGVYAPGKVPDANYDCTDPDDVPGDSDIASCEAFVDGAATATASGDPLPDSIGTHTFEVVAIDEGGNHYHHTHTYQVKSFADLFRHDGPIAYYRLGDPSGSTMADHSGNGRNGEYKNDQDSGPTGISGDGDRARDFFGAGGYGYVNGIAAPRYGSTLEAWVKPLGNPDPAGTEFDGGSTPGGWNTHVWNAGGGVTYGDGFARIDGARLGTDASHPSGRTLDFRATFPSGDRFVHGGFGADYNDPPWAMFSVKGDGHLYARSDNGSPGGSLETHLGTSLLDSPHRFRVEWTDESVDFYVDGAIVASHDVSFGGTHMRPLFSEFEAGGPKLHVDWARMSPHTHRDASIVGHGDAGEIYTKDGYFRFRHMDKTVTSSVPVKPGKWQQVVGTWDGVDIRIYVDGQLAGVTEQTKRPSSVSTFYVGYGELAPWFRGAIDEVAYYGIALPPARVFQHFLADPPPAEAGDPGSTGDPLINPPGVPEDPPDPPVDPPVEEPDPTHPGGPSGPPVGGPSGCEVATAALADAKADLAAAKTKLRKARKAHKKVKIKRAKKAVGRAKSAVAIASSATAERC